MLHRVGAALSRLIKPISLNDESASRLTTQNEGQNRGQSSEQRKPEQGFQKAQPEVVASEKKGAAEAPKEAPAPARPGLTTAFLNLLSRLEERRRSIKLWPSAKNYAGGASRKKSSIRKGIVLDHKVE